MADPLFAGARPKHACEPKSPDRGDKIQHVKYKLDCVPLLRGLNDSSSALARARGRKRKFACLHGQLRATSRAVHQVPARPRSRAHIVVFRPRTRDRRAEERAPAPNGRLLRLWLMAA